MHACPKDLPLPLPPAMRLALDASFGSARRWHDAFVAMARSSAGSGWLMLVFQPRDASLVNRHGAEPGLAAAGGVPILTWPLGGDAHQGGASAATGAAVETFMRSIDWAAVHGRYQQAVSEASEALGAGPDERGDALVIDVRRAAVFEQAGQMISGAHWRDPSTITTWAAELPPDRDVLVYCVQGHELSRAAALRLRAAGLHARYLRGGIDGWSASQRPLVAKPAGPTP